MGDTEIGAAPSYADESGPDFTADHLVHANDCKVSELGVTESSVKTYRERNTSERICERPYVGHGTEGHNFIGG